MKQCKLNAMSDLTAWLCYLETIHPKTIDMGLDRVKHVATKLDLLKPAPYVFTVAGTNGKGTTCKTIEMILLAAGFRIGVYSSPHMVNFTERVRINSIESTEQATIDAFVEIEHNRGETSLTYFEVATLAALYQFRQAKLDVVILEVGLGGRLDATNIIDADVAVITSIGIDHVSYLGDNRESIGQEKAGIFKEKSLAIVGEPDMPSSIMTVANQINCLLYAVNKNWAFTELNEEMWSFKSEQLEYHDLPIPNVPIENAATAIAALTYSELKVTNSAVIDGLKSAHLPGRFQQIQKSPTVIVDVAHNPHAAAYLQKQLTKLKQRLQQCGKMRFVVGMLKDKDIKSTLLLLDADAWYCATLSGERGCDARVLEDYLQESKSKEIKLFPNVIRAFKQAQLDANENDIIIVCGSFHTVSEVLTLHSITK